MTRPCRTPRARFASLLSVALASCALLSPLAAMAEDEPLPNLNIMALEVPRAAITGETVTFHITISNDGEVTAANYSLFFHISPAAQVTSFNPLLASIPGPALSPGQVVTADYQVQLPPAGDPKAYKAGLPYQYTLGVIADELNTIGESNGTLINNSRFNGQTYVSAPAPDFEAVSVEWNSRAVAGTVVPVTFEVANAGVLNAETLASFFVSTNDRITTNDLQVGQVRVALAAGGRLRQTAWIYLPATLAPSSYYLGMVLNPEGSDPELTQENNEAVSSAANVSPASLYIQTSAVADALLGAPYVQSLVASGGTTAYQWRLAGGTLPIGLALSSNGLLSGTPQSPGTFLPVIEVKSGESVAQTTFILRAYDATGPLEVATKDLPPAVVGGGYEIRLAALGGTPPYTWSLPAGSLPTGLTLSETGVISGKAAAPSGGAFTVAVKDNRGTTATKQLTLRALNASDLAVVQSSIDDAAAGRDFSFLLQAMGGSPPYTWSLAAGALPKGLALSPQDDGFLLSGKPAEAGLFTFAVRVEDAGGQSDRSQFVMLVNAGQLQIVTTTLPDAQRGQPYDVTLTSSAQDVVWALESGELPTGLSLDAAGHLRGTVSASANARMYTLLVNAQDGNGSIGRMGLSLLVQAAATNSDSSGGCGQTSSGMLGLVLVALALVTRRGLRKASIVAAMLLMSATAMAATPPAFSVLTESSTYQPLVGASTLAMGNNDNGLVAIPLSSVTPPFVVPYLNQQISTFTVGVDGILLLGMTPLTTSSSSNTKFPSTSAPKNILAPYWTDLYILPSDPESGIRWALTGTAPNRVLTVEWGKLLTCSTATCGGATFSFQAQITEGGEITYNYGERLASGQTWRTANIGLQNADGTVGFNAPFCTSSCTFANWPAAQSVRFTRLANLIGTEVSAPTVVYGGVDASFSAKIGNSGAANATGVSGNVYLSPTQTTSDSMVLVWTLSPQNISIGATQTYSSSTVRVPLTTPPGIYYPILVIDPSGTVPQSGPPVRTFVGSPLKVGDPGPDLQVSAVTTSAVRASVGDSVPVTLTLANKGNVDTLAHWRVVLAVSDSISLSDRVVKEDRIAVAVGESKDVDGTFTIPNDLLPGTYYLGAIATVDESAPASEINAFNNTAHATSPLTVTAPLAIVTEALPDAMVGAQYAFRLLATGGDGFNLWTLPNGVKMPEGLALSPSGDITGSPKAAGTSQFRINLTSNQSQTVSAEFTLNVTESGLPLAFPTTQLPTAIFELDYAANLMATGGTPPYAFTLRNASGANVLPLGLAFDAVGAITGVPRQTGTFPLSIDVTDRTGKRVSRDLALTVVASSRPYVDLQELPDASLGKTYSGHLTATGGTPPYKWQELSVRRMGDAAGPSTDEQSVPGLSLADTGDFTGVPGLVGTYEIAVRLTDSVDAVAYGVVTLAVRSDNGVAILTRQLPNGEINKAYDETIVVTGGDGQLTFTLDSDQQPLPAGLVLSSDGHVTGTPTQVTRQTFIVRVTDGSGRTDVRALTLDVRAPANDDSKGCNATGAPTLLGLLVLVFALRRGRSFRVTGAVAVATLAVLSLGGCSSKNNEATPCADVKCQPGEECDPSDNLCKCGGLNGRACSEFEQCNASTLSCELLDRCFLVSCVRGMVCDSADGVCKCGAETCGPGTVCATAEKTCVEKDPCAEVTCAGGMTCDSDDGRCKCGGTGGGLCDIGERCVDGACQEDLCASVECTGGTTCDPTDGRCHCGADGEVCAYGQTCLPQQKKCQTSTLCAAVRCSGGSSCDPADGQCHCGGAGGPVCGGGQSCDIAAQRCVGGDQCFNKTCPTNTVCDPEDGSCRCGSAGTVCSAQELCIGDADTSRICRTVCDPVSQTPCPSTQSCGYDVTTKLSLCNYLGSKTEGSTCDSTSQCSRGLGCVAVTGSTTKVCRAYCARPDGTCEDLTRSCKAFTGAPSTLGACLP